MYGLPGQTLEDWAHTLAEVVRLPIDSVSIFYLIRKQSVPMQRHPEWSRIPLPQRADSMLMHIMAREALQQQGFVEALTDHFHREYPQRSTTRFRSNLIYSDFFVIPVGISGWGYLNSHHYWNTFSLGEYEELIEASRLSVTRAVHLDEEERLRRDVMFCLKYGEVPFAPFRERYGVDLMAEYRHVFDHLDALGLVTLSEAGAELTYAGRLFLEETCGFFFSDRVLRDVWATGTGEEAALRDTFHYMVTPKRPESHKVLAVVAHPRSDSFVHELCHAFASGARLCGHEVTVLDLYAEGYQSHLAAEEIGATEPREDVRRHQELVREAGVLAFFYPIWWYSAPAILRGWFERTLMLDFAFSFSLERRYEGLLGDKKAVVVSTAGDTEERFDGGWGEEYVANQIERLFDTVGIERRWVRVFCNLHHRDGAEHRRMLEEAAFVGRNVTSRVLFAPPAAQPPKVQAISR